MKKILSFTGLISIVLLLYHSIICACLYAGIMPYAPKFKTSGKILTVFVLLHFICNVVDLIKNSNGKIKCKQYRELNKENYMQNLTGYLTIVFVILHIIFMACFMILKGSVLYALCLGTQIIFAVLLFVHLYLSVPRLAITLGLASSEKSFKIIKICTFIIDIIVFFFIIAVQLKYYMMLI